MSWAREGVLSEDTSLTDPSSRIDNGPYNAYLSRHSNNRGGIIFMALLASGSSIFFLYLVFGWLFCTEDPSLGRGDSCGDGAGTLLIFLGFISIILWIMAITSYDRSINTTGGINFEETSTGAGFVAWQEENDLPGNYSNWGELIFSFIWTVSGFGLTVMFLHLWLHFVPTPEDPDESTPIVMVIVFGIVFFIGLRLFVRAVRRHLLFRQYSNAPLLSGVFSEDPNRVIVS